MAGVMFDHAPDPIPTASPVRTPPAQPGSAAMVEAVGLRKRFGGPDGFEAVRGIDVRIERGEAFGFLGPNGAGKSSTMRMVCAVSDPSGGSLRVLGLAEPLVGFVRTCGEQAVAAVFNLSGRPVPVDVSALGAVQPLTDSGFPVALEAGRGVLPPYGVLFGGLAAGEVLPERVLETIGSP